jgi:hypothetical protein
MTSSLRAAVGEVRIGGLELVAEGDAVFARLDYELRADPPLGVLAPGRWNSIQRTWPPTLCTRACG